jgi:hypothetical protein
MIKKISLALRFGSLFNIGFLKNFKPPFSCSTIERERTIASFENGSSIKGFSKGRGEIGEEATGLRGERK